MKLLKYVRMSPAL